MNDEAINTKDGKGARYPVLDLLRFIAALLRLLHNLMGKHVHKGIERYCLESKDYEFPRIGDAVAALAKAEAKFYAEGDDVYIPADAIALLSRRYRAFIVPIDILYDIDLENYLKAIKSPLKQNKGLPS